MKIESLSISNFRGFPFEETIRLEGKNLLVYGENGAGKSSIYHALQGFFSVHRPRIEGNLNLFMQAKDPTRMATVKVRFDDTDQIAVWDSKHPGRIGGDSRVRDASLRTAILDYRSLLRTNFVFEQGALNWFRVLNEELLAGYQEAGGPTLHELWLAIQTLISELRYGNLTIARHARMNEACLNFTVHFRKALASLRESCPPVVGRLSDGSIKVDFPEYDGLTFRGGYPTKQRGLEGTYYEPSISFHSLGALDRPHAFLNEARQSQIALAIFLAGRKSVVPTDDPEKLRLLVLDDVLMGLDHSNRYPLLDLLADEFKSWQIILLTHDRVWFEMARLFLYKKAWTALEIHESTNGDFDMPMPLLRAVDIDSANASLDQARSFLADGFIGAAANYARTAFELKARMLCSDLGCEIPYQINPKKYSLGALIGSLLSWVKAHKDHKDYAGWDKVIRAAIHFKDTALNPHSHPLPELVGKAEVREAINVVEKFVKFEKSTTTPVPGSPLAEVQAMMKHGSLSQDQAISAMILLRAAWCVALDGFCARKSVLFPLRSGEPSCTELFSAAFKQRKADFVGEGKLAESDFSEVKKWLTDPIDQASWAAVNQDRVKKCLNYISPGNDVVCFLDA